MNERIKLLLEQAGITTNLDTDYFEKDMNKWVDYFSEKFAELIVRECLDACSRANEIRHFVPPTQEQVVLDCVREIERTFRS
jgi:HEPN domain-containing protein